MPENNNSMATPMPQAGVYPYVPGNSFFYQLIEDTALPKKYVMTLSDLKAQKAMEKALKGLQQLNWKKLELQLKQQDAKVNVAEIQRQIEKAMQQVDWKKINEESEHDMEEAQNQMQQAQDAFVVQLGNYQRDRAIQQERIKQAQQQILLDRLQQCEELKKLEEEKKKGCTTTTKRKRIVQI
jgi:hypothetical protein